MNLPDTPSQTTSTMSDSGFADPPIQPIQTAYLVIHTVACSQTGDHFNHVAKSTFLDSPRLVIGDSRATTLKGTTKLHDLNAYLDDHPEVVLVVHKHHSCDHYHNIVRDSFERLAIPDLDPKVLAGIRLHFFSLKDDGPYSKPYSEYMNVLSPELQEALSLVGISLSTQNIMHAPYLDLYHHLAVLSSANTLLAASQTRMLQTLLESLEESWLQQFEEARMLFSEGQVNERHLSKLYAPGDVLVVPDDTKPLAYVLEKCTNLTREESELPGLKLFCWSWQFEGHFRKEKTELLLTWPAADQTLPITSLSIHPLKYDQSGLEQRLENRGRTFWVCRKRQFVGYQFNETGLKVRTTSPRYMIDFDMYSQMHVAETDESSPKDELGAGVFDHDEPPTAPFVLLLPRFQDMASMIRNGVSLRNLSVESIREIDWNKKAFDQLVLDDTKKDLVKALVFAHVASNCTPDIIEGKGNGLIILLHGAPGTGKTLTAESVAELAEKPLYRVTCGDIGTDPEGVEKYLDSVLYIGTMWECVVLLDEADVFLEERTPTDLQRNAVVSVFLRVLEYYEGILILTSNRVGIFDEAFKSRIQLAMHYPPLEQEGRAEIWMNFIHGLEGSPDVNVKQLREKVQVLALSKLNGRQIRNTVNTARQLARYKKETLEYSHLRQAIKVTNEFEEYVARAHGHSDEEMAHALRTR